MGGEGASVVVVKLVVQERQSSERVLERLRRKEKKGRTCGAKCGGGLVRPAPAERGHVGEEKRRVQRR